jgi:hypothetical protein
MKPIVEGEFPLKANLDHINEVIALAQGLAIVINCGQCGKEHVCYD